MVNLFILYLLANTWILYECYLNKIPYSTIFDPGVILGPVMLTIAIGTLGELIVFTKNLELSVSQKEQGKPLYIEDDQDEWSY